MRTCVFQKERGVASRERRSISQTYVSLLQQQVSVGQTRPLRSDCLGESVQATLALQLCNTLFTVIVFIMNLPNHSQTRCWIDMNSLFPRRSFIKKSSPMAAEWKCLALILWAIGSARPKTDPRVESVSPTEIYFHK